MTHIPDELRSEVALRAECKCEYCRLPDRLQSGGFEMDHIVPASTGGATTTIARLQLNHPELVAIRRELARLGLFSI